jgi:hypothetical protein
MRKRKKAQAITNVVKLIIALVVMGILIFIAYKFILTPGEQAGSFASCEAQKGTCTTLGSDCVGKKVFGLGCPGNALPSQQYCCLP